MDIQELKDILTSVPDFPKKGIVFKDINGVLGNVEANKTLFNALKNDIDKVAFDAIIGLDSRGFLYGNSLALALDKPFVMARKAGKLPPPTTQISYELEYGSATIEIPADLGSQFKKVWIHDDLLATGGTALALAQLLNEQNIEVVGFSFAIELTFIPGRETLKTFSENISSIIKL